MDRVKPTLQIIRDTAAFLGMALTLGVALGGLARLADLSSAVTYALAGGTLGLLVVAGVYWIIGRRLFALENRRKVHAHEPAVLADKRKDREAAAELKLVDLLIARNEHVLVGGAPGKPTARWAIPGGTQRINRIDVGIGVHGFDPMPKQRA